MSYRIWDVLFIDFPFPDKKGTETRGERPAVVVQAQDFDEYPTLIVVPLTEGEFALHFKNSFQVFPTPINGLRQKCCAMPFQVRAIDKKRIIKKAGVLEDHYHRKMIQSLLNLFPSSESLSK
jgi:mRNA interferase MazF